MKTVKEYANSVGKSHQSVYKQLNSKKNKERLENHVWKQDGTTYLDDVAIDILNESRQMIQIQNDIQAHEDNDNLRKEVNDLKNKIINLQDELKVKTVYANVAAKTATASLKARWHEPRLWLP